MRSNIPQRICIVGVIVSLTAAFALFCRYIVLPTWELRRWSANIGAEHVTAMQEAMQRVAAGEPMGTTSDMPEIMPIDAGPNGPSWEKLSLICVPLGIASIAFIGFIAFRFGFCVAFSELVLLSSLAIALWAFPSRPSTKTFPFDEGFRHLRLLLPTAVGTYGALHVVQRDKSKAIHIVVVSVVGGGVAGGIVAVVQTLPFPEPEYLLNVLIGGSIQGAFPGALFGAIAGYLYYVKKQSIIEHTSFPVQAQ